MAGIAHHGDAEASKTYPTQCSTLRKGGHVMLKRHPCKIVEMMSSAPGKHGHSKMHIVGLDILTGRRYEDIYPSSHKVQVPLIARMEYQLIDIQSDGFLGLMDSEGIVREDLKLPEGELGKEIQQRYDHDEEIVITVIKVMEEEAVVAVKKQVPGRVAKISSM